MAKKATLKEVGETLAFIVDKMATKTDIEALKTDIEVLDKKIDGVNVKVAAVQKTLDDDTLHRADLQIPRRVHALEEDVFGPGRSKHPKHLPL